MRFMGVVFAGSGFPGIGAAVIKVGAAVTGRVALRDGSGPGLFTPSA